MNTFDRYLLRRFFHVFVVGLIATYGLFVVFDAFTNADEFQDRSSNLGTQLVLLRMAQHYFLQAFPFLDLIGPTLAVISVMGVFALLLRNREIYPVLSAGVPTYRLAVPVMVGILAIIAALTVNQELIVPGIADRLQAPRGTEKTKLQKVQTSRDFVTDIEVGGNHLDLGARLIENAEFLLPVPSVVREPVTLRAARAIFIPAKGDRPAGWLLKEASPAAEELKLTDKGSTLVYSKPGSRDLFVVTDVTIDQLHNRATSFKYLSTLELVQRIRNPAFGIVSIRSQTMHLHERLTRPLLILSAAMIVIPFTMRKESRGLLANLAVAAVVMSVLFAAGQGLLYLGRISVLPLALAAWVPVVMNSIAGTWVYDRVQT